MHWDGVHALVGQAKAGDGDAWERLTELARPYLLGVAQRLLGPDWPRESLNDLLQTTWLQAFRGLPDFAGGDNDANTGAVLRAWLLTSLRNTFKNSTRKPPLPRAPVPVGPDSSAGGIDPPDEGPTASTQAHRAEDGARLRQALARLQPEEREL